MPKWTAEMDTLLGTMKDANIARRFGHIFSIGFIANRRRALGIPYMRKHPAPPTDQYYNFMLKAQDGGCWICGMTPEEHGRRLFVDHDNDTGIERGLLCHGCNI